MSPTRYGEPRHTATRGGAGAAPAAYWDYLVYVVTWVVRTLLSRRTHTGLDIPRDEMEMRLLRYALERRLPVLGICRGEQLLNVFFGGSLYQELTGYYEEDPEIRTLLPRKAIQVVPHSQLAKILGSWPMRVNALHRQAVAALGRGIAVSARDRNGIVQAIEHQPSRFVIGVQWHPEFLPHIPRQRVLFRELIRAARGDKPIGVTDYTESGSARSEG